MSRDSRLQFPIWFPCLKRFVATGALMLISLACAERSAGMIERPFVGSEQADSNVAQCQLRMFATRRPEDLFAIRASGGVETGPRRRSALRRAASRGWGGRL